MMVQFTHANISVSRPRLSIDIRPSTFFRLWPLPDFISDPVLSLTWTHNLYSLPICVAVTTARVLPNSIVLMWMGETITYQRKVWSYEASYIIFKYVSISVCEHLYPCSIALKMIIIVDWCTLIYYMSAITQLSRMFLPWDFIWEHRNGIVAMEPLFYVYIPTSVFYRGVSGFVTGCPWGFWGPWITHLIHVSGPFFIIVTS